VHGTQDRHARVLPRAPARARVMRRTATARGPIRSADGADNIGTALLLELPDRAVAVRIQPCRPGYLLLPRSPLYSDTESPVRLADGSIVEMAELSSRVLAELHCSNGNSRT
jgi:hypothetical protein